PRKAPPCKCGGGFVRSLREHGMRAERAQLTRDAHGQRREEGGAVERRQGRREMKVLVMAVAACEHAEVELAADSIPLARQAGRERQLHAPRHEQHARLHARATRRNVDSSSPKTRSGAYAATDCAAAPRRRSRSASSAK